MPAAPKTRFVILGLLTLGPMSGYDIKKACEETVSHFWKESYGQIYPTLARLRREGQIRIQPRPARNRRRRVVYEITAKGRCSLLAWLKQPVAEEPVRRELSLKVFFGRQLSRSGLTRHLRHALETNRAWRAFLEKTEVDLLRDLARHPDLPYWRMTVRLGIRIAQARAAWAQESLRELEKSSRPGKRSRS